MPFIIDECMLHYVVRKIRVVWYLLLYGTMRANVECGLIQRVEFSNSVVKRNNTINPHPFPCHQQQQTTTALTMFVVVLLAKSGC
mmetsp:Transcript_26750/g.29962  ORF Transcript_26750/g.29962 Transcript_26750/m.29962 type:complete len:85 (+) Transcript_26750:47-301(+)